MKYFLFESGCSSLMLLLLTINQGYSFTYICENDIVDYAEGMVLIAPGFSNNPGRVKANCNITVHAPSGRRMEVSVYQLFSIGDCSSDFVSFRDGVTLVTKCGNVPSGLLLFTTSTSLLHIWYNSQSYRDKVALSIRGFGCNVDDLITGGNYELTGEHFSSDMRFYQMTVTCHSGYVISRTNATTLTDICEKTDISGYIWQGGLTHHCQISTCKNLPSITNGELFLPSVSVGSTALYTCNPGYRMFGLGLINCVMSPDTLTVHWDLSPPACHIKSCGPLSIENADYESPDSSVYQTEVVYSCRFSNFTAVVAVCTQQGSWSYTSCPERPLDLQADLEDDYRTLVIILICMSVGLLILLVIIVVIIIIIKRKMLGRPSRFRFSGPDYQLNYAAVNSLAGQEQPDNSGQVLRRCPRGARPSEQIYSPVNKIKPQRY